MMCIIICGFRCLCNAPPPPPPLPLLQSPAYWSTKLFQASQPLVQSDQRRRPSAQVMLWLPWKLCYRRSVLFWTSCKRISLSLKSRHRLSDRYEPIPIPYQNSIHVIPCSHYPIHWFHPPQLFYIINAYMLNNLLLRRDMCHWTKGVQIR